MNIAGIDSGGLWVGLVYTAIDVGNRQKIWLSYWLEIQVAPVQRARQGSGASWLCSTGS
jgi:hypothetical protein